VLYETGALELMQGRCHPGAAYAQHQRHELVGEQHLWPFNAVLAHEQPAREPLFQPAVGVRQGRVCGLHVQDVGEAQENVVKRWALCERTPKVVGLYALPFALDLNETSQGERSTP
jgi:hypothetical protein